MNLLPDGVVLLGQQRIVEWCNQAAGIHLGIGMRDEGAHITDLVSDAGFADFIETGAAGVPLRISIGERELVLQLIPFERGRLLLVSQDVTDAVRIDEMRRDFVANASHELRTPLTVINGFLEIALARPNLDAPSRALHLQLMAEQGRRMQALLDDMLTLTRLESTDHALASDRVDICAMVDQICIEAKALSAGRHAISHAIDGPDLHGNAEELRSAFSNLISNAVRYTPDGGSIHIEWSCSGDALCFRVRDTGIGIARQDIPRLTERFYRVDKGLSRGTNGTGLGLAIVKHVLMRHDATLRVESEPGVGSCFIAEFPLRLVCTRAAGSVRSHPAGVQHHRAL